MNMQLYSQLIKNIFFINFDVAWINLVAWIVFLSPYSFVQFYGTVIKISQA